MQTQKWFWCNNDTSGVKKRVWLEGWPGDRFNVLTSEEFEEFSRVCEKTAGMSLEEYFDDEE